MAGVVQPISLSEAKARLTGLVHAVENGEVVHLSRHGKPVAVLLSEQAYAALQGHQKRPTLWQAIVQWRGEGQAGAADDWPVAADEWRDRSSGRELSLE